MAAPPPLPANPSHEPPSSSPPPFQPLFTLLTTASQTYHPTVHYLFTNDPTDTLSTAALDTLTSSPPTSANTPATQKERYMIIDLDASGTKVVAARSMNSEWAVTGAEVGKAPTWGEEGVGKGDGEGGMMLRIEGVQAARELHEGKGKEEEVDMEELVERYTRGLEGLRRVVEGVGAEGEGNIGG